jgi:hypothetical protein
MSKILDVLKKVPQAIKGAEANLVRSDQGIRDFPGKGLLTALVDTSGSELQRQRKMEDDLKQSMVKPLIEKYWMGTNEQEREAVAGEIKRLLGGGRQTKAFLDKMFEVGGQIHGVNKILAPPPGAAEGAAQEAVQASAMDAGASTDVAQPTDVMPPPPAPQPLSTAGPTPVQPTLAPPPVEGPQQPPLQSALSKMFPPGLAEQDKIQMQHANAMELQKQAQDAALSSMKAQIEAGRFEKGLKIDKGIEIVDGKPMRVLRWYDGTNEVKKEIQGEAPRNWASKPRPAFLIRDGKVVSALLNPLTNQIEPGSERDDVAPPAALLPRISERDYVTLDDDGNLVTIPLRSTRGVVLPGSGTGSPGPGVGGGPGTVQSSAQPDEAIVNFMIAKSRGNMKREDAVASLQELMQKAPDSLATIRQQAAQEGFLTAPPTGASLPGASGVPPATLPGGSSGAVGRGTQGATVSAPGFSLTPPSLESRKFDDKLPPGQWNLSKQREIPVREAYTQLVGIPEFPDMPSMITYASVADDPVRREKLANAVKLTHEGLGIPEKAHGSLINLIKYYAGIPEATIAAQTATTRSVLGDAMKDDPELQDAYTQTMAVLSVASGLRGLTKAGVAEAAIQRIINEIPVIGLNAFSSREVYSKLARVMQEVYNGAKNTPTVKADELQYIADKLNELNRLARPTGLRPPPGGRAGAAPTTPTAPAGNVMRAINRSTGERMESTDGGQTWRKIP